MEFPLITDLAIILIAAGVMGVICRAIKLPILVGYLLAGVLTGPHVPFMPNIHDMQSIETWSQIGIIFLLFALGLEFNFKDLFRVGKTGLITVSCIVGGMMMSCFGLGAMLGWSTQMCIFMGGILSISSTMIIVKAFEELGLKGQPFTNTVFGVEIFEDILSILMLVILPMFAISQGTAGAETAQASTIVQSITTTVMKVIFFLVLWFVGGIFLVPTLLRKLKKHLSDEMLLIISLALCLGMVMLAAQAHLSTALGAFTIGSILGTTSEAHRIEKLMAPVKNLFGAIFFVSIGMMVVPGAILDHIGTILLIFVLVLTINPVFGFLGVFLSGKSIREAVQTGSCFGQIGEFSFIIAQMGVAYSVLDASTYPIVITVSAITMVTTPYYIKMCTKLPPWIEKRLPADKKYLMDADRSVRKGKPNRRLVLLKQYAGETFILSMVVLGIITLLGGFVEPIIQSFIVEHLPAAKTSIEGIFIQSSSDFFGELSDIIHGRFNLGANHAMMLGEFISKSAVIGLTLLIMMPFLSALILRRHKLNRAFLVLLVRGTGEKLFHALQIIRVLVVIFFIILALVMNSPFIIWVNLTAGAIILLFVTRFNIIFSRYMLLERQFLLNYNEAEDEEEELEEDEHDHGADKDAPMPSMAIIQTGGWLSDDISVASIIVDEDTPFIGRTLIDLNLRARLSLQIISIERGGDTINIPAGQECIELGDTVNIAGTVSQLRRLCDEPDGLSIKKLHIQSIQKFSRTAKEKNSDSGLRCIQIAIHAHYGFAGKKICESGISGRNKCLVIGIETAGRVEMNIHPNDILSPGSRLWVIGEPDMLTQLIAENLEPEQEAEDLESPQTA